MSLKGQFIKVYHTDDSINLDESFWEIWDDDHLLAKLTIKDLRKDVPWLDYEMIATRSFGELLLKRFKKLKAFW